MRTRTWLGMMSGLCCAVVTVRADAPPVVVVAPDALPTVDLQVDASDAGTPAVWEALQKGSLSPEEAWKQGLLDAATVQVGLNQGLAGGEDDASKRLRVSLGGLLVQHAPNVTKDALKQPKAVQLALADFYASQNDEKAVPLYEAVWKQTTAPYEQGLLALALGSFWSNQNQPQKAQDAYMRSREVLVGKHSHLAAEMLLVTARAWAKVGNQEKARLFYAKTAEDGDGWMSGIAIWDQASALIQQRRNKEAQQFLETPQVKSVGATSLEARAITLSTLTYAYYRSGNFVSARQVANEATVAFEGLALKPTNPVQLHAHVVSQCLDWIRQWEKSLILCEPSELHLGVLEGDKEKDSSSARVRIRTSQDVWLVPRSMDARIKVRLANEGDSVDKQYFLEKEVIVEVNPHQIRSNFDTSIEVSSPQLPNVIVRIPVRVQIKR